MDTFSAATLPSGDNVNPYAFCVDLQGEWFLKKGAMIAHYGTVDFQAVTAFDSTRARSWPAGSPAPSTSRTGWWPPGPARCCSPTGATTSTPSTWTTATSRSRRSNLLGFAPTLELKQSIVPGFVTLIGTGTFLASSNGPVIFVEPPFRADPEALLGWADCPSPAVHYDTEWMAGSLRGLLQGAFGRESGEERQYAFIGAGTVLLQSSEVVREDPALLRMIEQQTPPLSRAQAGHARPAARRPRAAGPALTGRAGAPVRDPGGVSAPQPDRDLRAPRHRSVRRPRAAARAAAPS